MAMTAWIDTIIVFLAVSSALLLALGALSYLVLRFLKIRGKPNLWICTILMLTPFIYPLNVFLPDAVRVPVPMPAVTPLASGPVSTVTVETPLDEAGIVQPPSIVAPAGASTSTVISATDSTLNRPTFWKIIVASAWTLPLLFFLFRSILMAYGTRRLLRYADPVNDPEVLELIRQCAAETGVRKAPEVKRIDPLPTPMLMGVLRPTILLPGHLLTAPFQEGLRFTLLHELKHLRRRDNWWLLVESVVGAAYFFHPVVHWARKRIHEEWEYLCDHHVIRVTRKSASYADFLLHEVWNHGHETPHPAVAVPFITPGASKTARRVHAILENSTSTFFTEIRGNLAVGMVFASLLSLLTLTTAPPVREETASAAPVATRLLSLPGVNDSVSAVTKAESLAMQPPTDTAATDPTLPVSTPSLAASTDSLSTTGKTDPATSATPADSGEPANREATSRISAKIDTVPTSSALEAPIPKDVDVPDTQEITSATPKDVTALKEPVVSPAAPMLLAGNDSPKPGKQAQALETERADPDTATDKYADLDKQLEEVSDISISNIMSWDWQKIDGRSFVLQTSPSGYYLILLQQSAYGLMFTETIAFSNIGSKIKPGYDRVTVFGPSGREDYIIHKIFKLKDSKEAKQILEQLS